MSPAHQTVQTLVAPGDGGLPRPRGEPGHHAAVVPVPGSEHHGAVQAAQQQVALQLEVVREGPESLARPGPRLPILIQESDLQRLLHRLNPLLQHSQIDQNSGGIG